MSTSQRKLGYAVLGLGIGMAHADAAYASDRADLVAVCDLIQEKMDKVVERYPGTKTYLEFDEMLKDAEIDVISICLPSAMHADFAVRAMEAGKNVLVEKPMARTYYECCDLIKTAKDNGDKYSTRIAFELAVKGTVQEGFMKLYNSVIELITSRQVAYPD